MAELVAMMLTAAEATHDLTESAGEFIAEYARFNAWAYGRKGRTTTADLANIAALMGRMRNETHAAWQAHVESAPTERAQTRRLLLALLDAHRAHMLRARQADRLDLVDPDMPAELLDLD